MNIKLDENLPEALVHVLASLGHDVDTVRHEGLTGHTDPVLSDAVLREGRFLITQDLDFSDVRKFAPGSHGGILVLRLKAPGRLALLRRVKALFSREPESGLLGEMSPSRFPCCFPRSFVIDRRWLT